MKDEFSLPALTPSETVLLNAVAAGKSMSEASSLAYPESTRPLELAHALLDENDFVRSRFHIYMNEYDLSDRDIAKNLSHATKLAESNPKASGALLNATKFACEVKALLAPKPQASQDIQAPVTYLTQSQTINNYLKEAQGQIDDSEIDTIIDDDIIVIETIPKDVLFDN